MSESELTRQKQVRERREKPFVGREYEREAFRRNLDSEEPAQPYFAISGQAGVGKSTLLVRLAEIALERGALTALATEAEVAASRDRTIVQTMGSLARQLTEAGVPLGGFGAGYERYRACMRAIRADPSAPLGALDHLRRSSSWLAVGAPRMAHTGGIVHGRLREIVSNSRRHVGQNAAWTTYLESTFEEPTDRALIQQPVEVLTPLFTRGLNEHVCERTIVLCFDSWEVTRHHLGPWLGQIVDSGQLSNTIRLVLAGEDAPGPGCEPLGTLITRFELEPFTQREIRILLNWMGVTDPASQLELASLSSGVPVLLTTMASGAQRQALGGTSGPVEHHLASLDSARLRGIIVGCSAARRLDGQLLDEVSSGDDWQSEVRDWLTTLPFIESRPGYWRYHPEIRRLMLRYARRRSVEDSRAVHVRLAAYHRDCLGDHVDRLRELDASDRQHLLEATYHGLMVGQPAGIDQALEVLLVALVDDLDLAGEILATWSQAASEQESADEITLWGARARLAHHAVMEREWEALAQFSALVRARDGLSQATASTVAFFAGLAFQGLGEPEGALTEYDQALALGLRGRLAAACHHYRGNARSETGDCAGAASDMDMALQLGDHGASAAALFVSRADAYVHCGEIERAIADYDRAAALRPGGDVEATLCNNRGVAQLSRREFRAALVDLDRVLLCDLVPEAASATLSSRALAHLRFGALEQAIGDCDRSVDLQGEGDVAAVALTIRGLARLEGGHVGEAVEDLGRALAMSSSADTAAAASNNLGRAHQQSGELAEAIGYYDQAIQWVDDDVTALFNRAVAQYAAGRSDLAIADLDRTVELQPDQPLALLYRGNAKLEAGRSAEAIDDYDRFLHVHPDGADAAAAFSNRAAASYVLGRLSEAVADFSRAAEIKPKAAAVYHSRGIVKCELGEYSEGIKDYDRAVELGLEEAVLYNNRGLARARLHDFWEAVADYDRALELKAGAKVTAEIHLNRGMVYADLQDFARAVDDLSQAVDVGLDARKLGLALQKRAHAYLALQEYERAISDCDRVLALSSAAEGEGSVYLLRADAHAGMGEYERAVADYGRAIELLPKTEAAAMAYCQRGMAYFRLGDYALTRMDLECALDTGLPADALADTLATRGLACARLGEHEEAILAYDQAIDLEGDELSAASTLQRRGDSYFALGELRRAIADYDRALDLNTTDEASCYVNRGNAYAELGQRRRAIDDYDRAMRLSPADADIYFNRARVHHQLMEYEQSVAWYTKALELCGGRALAAEIHGGRGSAYASLGAYGPAIEDYGLALELGPEPGTASILFTNRGLARDRTRDFERAIEDYEQAVKLNPGNPSAHYSAACAYSQLWNPSEALRSLGKAIELDEGYREKAATEVDLSGIRETEGFKKLVGGESARKAGPSSLARVE